MKLHAVSYCDGEKMAIYAAKTSAEAIVKFESDYSDEVLHDVNVLDGMEIYDGGTDIVFTVKPAVNDIEFEGEPHELDWGLVLDLLIAEDLITIDWDLSLGNTNVVHFDLGLTPEEISEVETNTPHSVDNIQEFLEAYGIPTDCIKFRDFENLKTNTFNAKEFKKQLI